MADVVTLGETLAVVAAPTAGPLRTTPTLRLGFGGAESNVAIGLARLGHRVAWSGRVGDDEFGAMILERLRAERVDVSASQVDADVATALMVKEQRLPGRARVRYYRRDQAGSRLVLTHEIRRQLRAARLLHVTGITPALSPGARACVDEAVAVARAAGVPVSLDVNYRNALWTPEAARVELRRLAGRATVVFAGAEELPLLVEPAGRTGPAGGPGPVDLGDLAGRVLARGPAEVVVKRGADGGLAVTAAGAAEHPGRRVEVVDPVGAGDAFVAGYLSARLDGVGVADRLERAVTAGAFAVSHAGDWEGLPRRRELALIGAPASRVDR